MLRMHSVGGNLVAMLCAPLIIQKTSIMKVIMVHRTSMHAFLFVLVCIPNVQLVPKLFCRFAFRRDPRMLVTDKGGKKKKKERTPFSYERSLVH